MSIVTLTMNPAIDLATSTPRLVPIDKMRCTTPRLDPGGGGINVARTAAVLGETVTAMFPAGGHTGRLLEQLVAEAGISMRLVPVAGLTRENISVTDMSSGAQYRFVFPGVALDADEQLRCLDEVEEIACGARFLVVSGSLPSGVAPDFFQRLADRAASWTARLVVDTSGAALRALRGGVYLLKPSVRELGDCVGRPLRDRDEQIAAARQLITEGVARIVVVSLGAEGALAVTEGSAEWFAPIREPVISGIGAGDAMVGGITVGLSRGLGLSAAVRLGIAAATAALGTPGTAPGRPEHIDELYRRLDGRAAPETDGSKVDSTDYLWDSPSGTASVTLDR
ncbi:1-phosphofructokinase family hexose kinase [Nocardia sp. CDC159]|uniref:1-phosphofructokinase family hexose kinase n=1 Tax=Nocardia pulmonis TaxID=2951408 RepID=A0A9X2IX03_9NOCA|nr:MULTISPECIES: 1-phosphofructokinase family hexose kinase [Nocardia]MCM6772406.1 1-phosphofructokinase family hexose kinase [Nocardia pulmonis]MCM6784936.1 1-phosphofructokinase family hexose kinase [Nocardia sp. CDC159]